MTNQEAIRFGKCILMVADDKSDGTTIECTKLAIKALEQGDVLREIRQEIVGFRDDAEIRYGHQLGFDKIYAYERCIDLIDGKIKESSE